MFNGLMKSPQSKSQQAHTLPARATYWTTLKGNRNPIHLGFLFGNNHKIRSMISNVKKRRLRLIDASASLFQDLLIWQALLT